MPATELGRHNTASSTTWDLNTIVDLCAIVESFTVGRLLQCAAPNDYELTSWQKRLKAWQTYASVDLTHFPQWLKLRGFIEVRNAITHGEGRLTDMQLGKSRNDTLKFLCACAVALNGDNLTLRSQDVLDCARTCDEFIRWLDSAAPK